MNSLFLPRIEDLEVDDLASLPKGYRYELHEGSLVIMTPSSFWHKTMAGRLLLMLHAAGLNIFHTPGVRGDRPRDNRLPDLGVVSRLPTGLATYSSLPGSSYSLIIEIGSNNGNYTDKAAWYAQCGIPEYWIVDQAPDRSEEDALVLIHHLTQFEGKPAYGRERNILLSALEAEYRASEDRGERHLLSD